MEGIPVTQPQLFDRPTSSRQRHKILADAAPQIIKYMGSKAQILDFVVQGINRVYNGSEGVCDLFAGSCILSGAIGRKVRMFANDIQSYSKALAGFYLTTWKNSRSFKTGDDLVLEATSLVNERLKELPYELQYADARSLKEFNKIEERNRALIDLDFSWKWHLFTKFYSGTWWSAEQCVWIDSLREVAERYKSSPHYNLILAAILHAMAYSGSGTGHYAQYRDAKTQSSMRDIAIYRNRNLVNYFARKYNSLAEWIPTRQPEFEHEITDLDFKDRLATLPRCTVYADPPYAFVHYSRFYHAIETLYLYDFPTIQIKGGEIVKGRYREGRHQSPFCIGTQVPKAFLDLFEGVKSTDSNLVLSYSKSGMISFDDLIALARQTLKGYHLSVQTSEHQHMTMGRRADRHREVEEVLVLAKRK